jgi:hypothetical protein
MRSYILFILGGGTAAIVLYRIWSRTSLGPLRRRRLQDANPDGREHPALLRHFTVHADALGR